MDEWNEPDAEPIPPSRPPRKFTDPKRKFSLIDLLVLIGTILMTFALVAAPVLCKAREKARRVNCAGNLKQIGLALLMYSGENSGHFPLTPPGNNFEPLNTEGILNDGKVYDCPSAVTMQTMARQANFIYIGSGIKDDNIHPTTTVVAFDQPGNHPGNEWMNALFVDGHVEGARPDGSKTWNDADFLMARAGMSLPLVGPFEPAEAGTGEAAAIAGLLALFSGVALTVFLLWPRREEDGQ